MNLEELKKLHELLSQFEDLLARKSIPANWGAPGIEEIRYMQELIESECA